MKTNAIVRIVLFTLAILVLLGILLAGIAFSLFTFNIDERVEATMTPVTPGNNETFTFSPNEIRNIEIEWASGNITIQPGDTEYIQVYESGDGNPMILRHQGDELQIHFDDIDVYFGITVDFSKDLCITVPRDWVGNSLELEVASADLNVANLTFHRVEFEGASGECTFNDCTVGNLDVDTASGDIRFRGSLNTMDCDAASADCLLELTNHPSRIDMDTASGDLELWLPADCGFTLMLDALSGNLSTDFNTTVSGDDRYISGDGSCIIDVDAMSGHVRIMKNS